MTEGRRSRWGSSATRVALEPITGLNLSASQLNAYVTHVRLEEINRKLKTGDIYPSYRERSPSPEPIYDEVGKRVNGREDRHRRKLEEERARLIEQTIRNNPELNKEMDHQTYLDHILSKSGKRAGGKGTGGMAGKPTEKVWIPQEEFPHVNFIGLLIGPRGNTLKKMEAETGAKISIRGKGSAKEGKSDPASLAAADEPLHAYITADSEGKIVAAVELINKIIEHAASTPEEDNELKRKQLRELAILNGTLREDDMVVCSNCGQSGHRRYECPEGRNITNSMVCRICGGAGHMASDCLHRDNPEMVERSRQRSEHIDQELSSFLADLQQEQQVGQMAGQHQGYQMVPPPPPPPQMGYAAPNPWAIPQPPPPPPSDQHQHQ